LSQVLSFARRLGGDGSASSPLISKGYSAEVVFMKKKSLMETNRYLKDPAGARPEFS